MLGKVEVTSLILPAYLNLGYICVKNRFRNRIAMEMRVSVRAIACGYWRDQRSWTVSPERHKREQRLTMIVRSTSFGLAVDMCFPS